MSKQRALKAIRLEQTDMSAQCEVFENPEWISLHGRKGESFHQTFIRLLDEYQIDMTPMLLAPDRKVGEMTEYIIKDADPEEIYRFDPMKPGREFQARIIETANGIDPASSIDQMAAHYQKTWSQKQQIFGDTVLFPGAHWFQVFHYFAFIFGYEATAVAAYSNPRLFSEVLARFAKMTEKILTAWAQTSVEFMICHDDLAMSDRTIFAPDWYKEFIYPHYGYIWKPLMKADIPFIFFSDGKTDELLPDIADFGPSGFFLDEPVDLVKAAERFGQTHFLLGGIKTEILTSGSPSEIEQHVESCFQVAQQCRSLIINCAGHIMPNIPFDNLQCYLEACKRKRQCS